VRGTRTLALLRPDSWAWSLPTTQDRNVKRLVEIAGHRFGGCLFVEPFDGPETYPRVDGSIPSLATISNSMISHGFRASPADVRAIDGRPADYREVGRHTPSRGQFAAKVEGGAGLNVQPVRVNHEAAMRGLTASGYVCT